MELFAHYVAWNNYIDVRRVAAEIEEANAETELKVLEATAIVDNWGGTKDDRVTVTRAARDMDPEVRTAREKHDQAKARRKVLGVLANNMERGAALLSRELTRRVGRSPVEGRAGSWRP